MAKVKRLTQAERLIKAKREAEEKSVNRAKMLNDSAFTSAVVSEEFGKSMYPDLDLKHILEEVHKSVDDVQDGNMKGLEAMLVGQAKSLQTMFASMARRANGQEYLKQYTTYMNLALKAQAQSRATIQALVELKYPRQVIVTQQANIANGHQQVNNGAAAQGGFSEQYTHAHAGENQSDTNKLLERGSDEQKRLDTRTSQEAVAGNTTLEAVAKSNGCKNSRG